MQCNASLAVHESKSEFIGKSPGASSSDCRVVRIITDPDNLQLACPKSALISNRVCANEAVWVSEQSAQGPPAPKSLMHFGTHIKTCRGFLKSSTHSTACFQSK